MTMSIPRSNRQGISLVEILIGIMVLGIGVISLATLFPIGLLRIKRAVNDVRGTVLARSALNEVRVRNLLAPPFGPPAVYFSAYPPPWTSIRLTTGPGIPVIIDPLWMIQVQPGAYADRFGFVDFNGDGTPDFATGEGLLRVRGGDIGGNYPLELASEVFSSSDDLAYGDNESRVLPLQTVNPGGPPYLTPTYGTPFALGTQGLLRERRYTWMIVARKVSAGQVFHPGINGVVGTPVADADDVLENNGPDLLPNPPAPPVNPLADDPARDMLYGNPQPAPVGPFEVTIVAFYSRDFGSKEAVFATNNPPPPALFSNIFTLGSDVAILRKRTDTVPFPDIPLNSYIMDTTLDSANGIRNGYVYRVVSKSTDATTGDLILVLDQKARANGYVLTVLKGAVGVYEKQVP